MRTIFLLLSFAALLSGCAQSDDTAVSTPILDEAIPWRSVQSELAGLRESHAHRSEFERLADERRRLRNVSELEAVTSRYGYSQVELSEHRRWFREAVSVIYYGFETNFQGVVFFDSRGRAAHALLFG